ncbi:ABC transporter permease [Clostridia bacterium]|nr:ABC transporter permease [Clostridia bacterium]
MRSTGGERVFYVFNYIVLTTVGLCTMLPFVHVVSTSLSESRFVISGSVSLWPRGLTLDAYRFAFANTPVITAFKNTSIITFVGTILSLLVESAAAYPLSIISLRGRKQIMYYFIFTMLFSSGLIPGFLLMRTLNLLNNLWSMILPHLVSVFNLILLKNYYEGLPDSIRESAHMDGANNITVWRAVVLPMSTPILATVALFSAVGFWNSYFNAMLYLSDSRKITLQLFLVNLVRQADLTDSITSEIIVPSQTVRAAAVIIGVAPILMVYPFIQRYFVTGITLGSVKG